MATLEEATVEVDGDPVSIGPSADRSTRLSVFPTLQAGCRFSEPWPVQNLHHRHLLQAAHADQLTGDLIERLRATGLYDRATLLVTSDHGMAFAPGQPGRADVVEATVPPVLWVPLSIKQPGQRTAETNDVNWEHVDLVPTLADLLGVKLPWPVDGCPGPTRRPAAANAASARSISPAPRGTAGCPAAPRRRTLPRPWADRHGDPATGAGLHPDR
jgi:hypothetical protein